ncbi:FMRFamide receptor-like [Gigantopelta aegis]|uniref:FMRFamide receptor-like n=1 Tax=Gigantopelta aegis TaxID=1735272 RepID=UPI001B88A989|nr:FMRFamide receptor-like [Gigantopelta aegis]
MTAPPMGSRPALKQLDEAPREMMYTLIGIAVVGVAGNTYAGVVWSSDKEKASTSLYLTVLSCCDSVFLLSKTVGLLLMLTTGVESSLQDHGRILVGVMSVTKFTVYGTAFLTVIVTVNRCVALFKPIRYVSLCSRKTAKILLTVVLFSCCLLTLPEVWKDVEATSVLVNQDDASRWNSYQHLDTVCFVLESLIIYTVPAVLVLVLNIVMFVAQKSHIAVYQSSGLRATRRKKPIDSIVALGLMYLVCVIVSYTFLNITSGRLKYFIHFDTLSLSGDVGQYVNASGKIVFYCAISEKFTALRKSFACKTRSGKSKAIDVNDYYVTVPWWLAPTESEIHEANSTSIS